MFVAKILNKPFTFTIHGIYDLYIEPPSDLEERAFFAKKVITISYFNKNYLIEKFNIPEEKIEVIHLGIDLDFFYNGIEKNDKKKIVLSVARLDPVKGLDSLIKACDLLRRRGIDFQCLIIGEGEERRNLESLIRNLSLGRYVFLLGAKKDEEVREFYRRSTVFVLPSTYETMGVATMEAMASRLPVISTRIYGIPELIDQNINGFLIKPGDYFSLSVYLEELLKNESKCKEMGDRGREKIESEFNLKTEVEKLIKVWLDEKS